LVQMLAGNTLAVLMCSVSGFVFLWPPVVELLGRRIRESVELQRAYPGYIWSQWFRQNLTNMGTLLAALLGTGGLLSQRSGGLFMLSLPASCNRLVWTRAGTGLAELFVGKRLTCDRPTGKEVAV
jgi:hypothetical protein